MKSKIVINICFSVVLFILFLTYSTSLSIPNIFYSKSIHLGDDQDYIGILTKTLTPTNIFADLEDVRKHMIFPIVAVPLFRLIRWLVSPIQFLHSFSLVLPFAITGTINLILGYCIFLTFFDSSFFGLFPKLLTILYGCCFSQWAFSSGVESYSITTMFVNLFLLYLCKHKNNKSNAYVAGALFALCILSTLSMVVMFIPVLLFFYLENSNIKDTLKKSLKAFVTTFIIVSVVYTAYYLICWLLKVPFGGGFGPKGMLMYSSHYLKQYCTYNLSSLSIVFRSFFIDSITYTLLQPSMLLLIFFYANIVILMSVSIIDFVKRRAVSDNIGMVILSFIMAYFVFHSIFNPSEAMLYSLPVLLPIIVILFWGINRVRKSSVKICCVSIFIVIVTMSNILVYFEVMKSNEFNLKSFNKESYRLQLKK